MSEAERSSRPAFTPRISVAGWFVDHQLIVVAWPIVDSTAQLSAVLLIAQQSVALDPTFIDCARLGDHVERGSRAAIMVASARGAGGTWTHGAIEVVRGGKTVAFGAFDDTSFLQFQSCLAEGLAEMAGEARARVIDVLASLVVVHSPVSNAPRLCRQLLRLRDSVRVPLLDEAHDVSDSHSFVVDSLSVVEPGAYYVQGWLDNVGREIRNIVAVSPQGSQTVLGSFILPYGRLGDDEYYADDDEDEPRELAAFSCFFQLPDLCGNDRNWVFELHDALGAAVESTPLVMLYDLSAIRAEVLRDLVYKQQSGFEATVEYLHAVIQRLQERNQREAQIVQLESYGTLPTSPEISIVVPLYKRIDLLEYQLAQFANDDQIQQADLIYVLDSPDLEDALLNSAAQLFDLFRVPFRLAILGSNAGYATATNLGNSIAQGRLLLLLNSDVLPLQPGWLGCMANYYDATPGIGALGPKLLYADDGIQHAGMYFHRSPAGSLWQTMHYYKALHRGFPAANVRRPVPAVSGACLMVARDVFLRFGGLAANYVLGDFEDSDFCLRLSKAGYEHWYVPEVELYHLEALSYSAPLRQHTYHYNAWLHAKLWGDRIGAVMSRPEFQLPLRPAAMSELIQISPEPK